MTESPAKLLMCPPSFFQVEYVINPWMDGQVGRADLKLAQQQWQYLHGMLSERAEVELIDPDPHLPDMVFMANAGLVIDNTAVVSQFLYRERQPETVHGNKWFREAGYKVVTLPERTAFEGEGDALLQPGLPLLWAGYGVRSALEAYRELGRQFNAEIIPLRLVDNRFYHLDTCLCPLPNGKLYYYPDAFDRTSLQTIRARIAPEDRYEVLDEDALHFACNAVEINGTVFANYFSDNLRGRLRDWGFDAIATPLTEFMRAGGAAKCLVLRLNNSVVSAEALAAADVAPIRDRTIELRGHLLDSGVINSAVDLITDMGGSFEIEHFQPGLRKDQESIARIKVTGPTLDQLEAILTQLLDKGARLCTEEERDAVTEPAPKDGVAPDDFYSTTIFPTDVRINGRWIRAENQRMDVALVISDGNSGNPRVRCTLMRNLKAGDRVVVGVEGIQIHPVHADRAAEEFSFMSSGVSSERRVEVAVEEISWEMKRIRDRGGKVVVVAGPVVIHTGGGPHLARLICNGFVQSLLGGNAIAVHDMEQAIFGTSLGVDLKRGTGVHGGHRHHLRVINMIRSYGSIEKAVKAGVVQGGVMYECVKHNVPFVLAGSIRDDGPLPETRMDLIQAQTEYAEQIKGADMILMLCSMLHSIGTGNMTPSGVKLICVDISPATVTKLADRGSVESIGIVTDVGLFLNLLAAKLCGITESNAHRKTESHTKELAAESAS